MKTLDLAQQESLERLIDSNGLRAVLEAIAITCSDKADHILASYSDKVLARSWDAACRAVFTAAHCEPVERVTP